MKRLIEQLLRTSLTELMEQGKLPTFDDLHIEIEHSRDPIHGEFATNVAMTNCKKAGLNPRALADLIVSHFPSHPFIENISIAGPGFINIYLSPAARHQVLGDILEQGHQYGHSNLGQQQRILLEFVSANPNGPLHVGHGRGAALGATLANILLATGHKVDKEYYVNDAGRQMDILAISVWLRYLEQLGETITFPSNGYKGDYVNEIAVRVVQQQGRACYHSAQQIFTADIPADETAPGVGDKEAHVDALIARARTLLGPELYQAVHQAGLEMILEDIKQDLAAFNVTYERWYSERSLFTNEAINKTIAKLTEKKLTYTRDGHLWFSATSFGDEKDRVLVRKNGVPTYFASDIAYHYDKFLRGFDKIIDIFGADHHGYIPRVIAAMTALDIDPARLRFITVQFATLWHGKEQLQMSTRSGSFVTLKDLYSEVGTDAARFFYVMRKPEQHMDFDLELAKSQSNDNPVYYIQYAHARICSIFNQLLEKQLTWNQENGLAHADLLAETHERTLITTLAKYVEVLQSAALNCEPHLLPHYLRELANDFHSYYNAHQCLVPNADLRDARLSLLMACKIVLANGLELLDVSTPTAM
jgi:arginyl-tRNA synthetase